VPSRKEQDDYAETAVLPRGAMTAAAATDDVPGGSLADSASEVNASYDEYLSGLEEVPTLRDIVREPPRIAVRDFRLGERPDVRTQSREDAYGLREQYACEVEEQYCEYVGAQVQPQATAALRGARKPAKKQGRAKRAKRPKRRKV
jgi:hypothetical protein